jgi:hypothetical protein
MKTEFLPKAVFAFGFSARYFGNILKISETFLIFLRHRLTESL